MILRPNGRLGESRFRRWIRRPRIREVGAAKQKSFPPVSVCTAQTFKRSPNNINKTVCSDAAKYDARETRWCFLVPRPYRTYGFPISTYWPAQPSSCPSDSHAEGGGEMRRQLRYWFAQTETRARMTAKSQFGNIANCDCFVERFLKPFIFDRVYRKVMNSTILFRTNTFGRTVKMVDFRQNSTRAVLKTILKPENVNTFGFRQKPV